MLRPIKIGSWLVLAMLITRCNCGMTPEEKRRKELVKEEKELTAKVMNACRTAKEKNDLEELIKEAKNDPDKLEELIKMLENNIEKLKAGTYTGERHEHMSKDEFLANMQTGLELFRNIKKQQELKKEKDNLEKKGKGKAAGK